jgi:translation initiation factor 6
MPHVITATYQGNSNIGLFCYANDKYCLVPYGMHDNQKKKFEEVLKVPVHEASAAGTDLLGVFFAGSDDCLLVPEIMFDSELRRLHELKIDYKVVKSELTALGNNLLVSKNMCIASPEYPDSVIKEIEKDLKIPVKKGKISDFDIVGSLAKGNTKGLLVSSDIAEFEKKFLKDNLKLNITTGTVNFGSPYISSGVVCNSNGFIIAESSGGPEIQNADEAFGFMDD